MSDITERNGSLHAYVNLSYKKRVFIVGDIHGEYDMLRDELSKVSFDENNDALIFVGDLADRGPKSEEALEWVAKPFVYRVVGNHDIAPRLYLDGQQSRYAIEKNFGGAWFTNKSRNEIEHIASVLENAPVALTVYLPCGKTIGVSHAECLRNWNKQVEAMEEGAPNRVWVTDINLWSRYAIDMLMKQQQSGESFDPDSVSVSDIDHVFHGHTILAQPFTLANRSWIDTGACMGGKLTLIDICLFLNKK